MNWQRLTLLHILEGCVMRHVLYILVFVAVATSAAGKEHFKYTDRNGIVSWYDDKSKIPPEMPIQFKYEDNNGITFWVDAENKIPEEYRKKAAGKDSLGKTKPVSEQTPVDKPQYSTRISIVNNVIIVPVVFRNKGRKVKARMILDTGASVTTLYAQQFLANAALAKELPGLIKCTQ